jgi:HEAT repeat protein
MRVVRLRRRDARGWFEQHAHAFTAYANQDISADIWWQRRVEANWGLISRREEAIPFAMKMLSSPNPDIREDGAGVLAELGRDERVVDELLRALDKETEHQPRDAMIHALGQLKSRHAIPFLAEVIRDPETDGDTRWDAADALGKIVGHRFDRQPEPISAARHWLEDHGF